MIKKKKEISDFLILLFDSILFVLMSVFYQPYNVYPHLLYFQPYLLREMTLRNIVFESNVLIKMHYIVDL